MTQGQKISKRTCDTAEAGAKERVIWDAGDGSVKGFGLRITPAGSKSFILMYRAGRGRAAPLRKATIGQFGSPWTVETARTEARRLLGQVAGGGDPAADKAEKRADKRRDVAAKDSVQFAIQEWLRRDQADNRTVADVRRFMEREVIPAWGDRALADIRKRDAIELIDGIADRGTKIMANRGLAYLRRFFNWCASRDLIESNPAAFVEKPAAEVRRDRVLDDGELVEVWHAAGSMVEPFAAGVRLLILNGARRSEIFEARKGELMSGAIRLPKERAKNAEGRLIHLSPPAQDIIAALAEWPACPYLLTSDGEHPFSGFGKAKAELDRRMIEARREADGDAAKPMAPWRLHDLRRSVATGMQRLGVRLEVVEVVLGHVSGSRAGIVGVYQRHRFEAEARAAVDLWGEHVMQRLDPTPAKVVPLRRRARS